MKCLFLSKKTGWEWYVHVILIYHCGAGQYSLSYLDMNRTAVDCIITFLSDATLLEFDRKMF